MLQGVGAIVQRVESFPNLVLCQSLFESHGSVGFRAVVQNGLRRVRIRVIHAHASLTPIAHQCRVMDASRELLNF